MAEPRRQPRPTSPPPAAEPSQNAPSARITWRAILIGLALIPLQCFWIVYAELAAQAADLSSTSLIISVAFVLFLLVLFNLFLRRYLPRLAFTQAELMLIYIMQAVSVGICGIGMLEFLVPFLGNIFYYGTATNAWKETFLPHISPWLLPQAAVTPDFYKGQSTFWTWTHVRGWLLPILTWSAYLLTLFWVMYCLNVIVRRPWVENERLTFPITQIPLAISQGEGDTSLFQNRLLWSGFLLPVVLEMLAGLNYFYPNLPFVPIKPSDPRLNLSHYFTTPPWTGMGYFVLSFYPLVIGITYFLPLDVAFSLWFFYLFTKVQTIASITYGYGVITNGFNSGQLPYLGEQSAGAFLGLACFSLYGMRGHLRNVLRHAFRRDPNAPAQDDAREPLSYRSAVLGGLAGIALLVAFGVFMGMGWYLAVIFFALYLLYLLAFTRVRAEAGLPWGFGPDMTVNQLMQAGFGTRAFSLMDSIGLNMMLWQNLDWRCVEMPDQLESLRIAGVARMRLRSVTTVILLATVVGLLSSWAAVLTCYYQYGAATAKVNDWRTSMGNVPWQTLKDWTTNPTLPSPARLEGVGVGFLVTAFLTAMRVRFVWWPFNPVGYAIAGTQTMLALWCPILVGWLAKAILIRYGGNKAFRRYLPFFLGLILGDYTMCGGWALYGCLTGIQTYRVFPI